MGDNVTAISPDQLAFLASIRDDPDNDTIRLAYADWLDEQPSARVKCTNCKGSGENAADVEGTPCFVCEGRNLVPDTSNADRAELIRVQCELANVTLCVGLERLNPTMTCRRKRPRNKKDCLPWCCECEKAEDLECRASALLAANETRWRAGPKCIWCEGKGTLLGCAGDRHNPDCPDCWGTGDTGGLMRRFTYSESDFTALQEPVHVTYHRGMKCVEVPHAADVWQEVTVDGCSTCRVGPLEPHNPHCSAVRKMTYHPTAWASAVCRHHPDVVEFWITDSWLAHDGTSGWDRTRTPPAVVDMAIQVELTWEMSEPNRRLTLARAVARWVRSFPEARA